MIVYDRNKYTHCDILILMLFVALGTMDKLLEKPVRFVTGKHPKKAKPAEQLHCFIHYQKVKTDAKSKTSHRNHIQKDTRFCFYKTK